MTPIKPISSNIFVVLLFIECEQINSTENGTSDDMDQSSLSSFYSSFLKTDGSSDDAQRPISNGEKFLPKSEVSRKN